MRFILLFVSLFLLTLTVVNCKVQDKLPEQTEPSVDMSSATVTYHNSN